MKLNSVYLFLVRELVDERWIWGSGAPSIEERASSKPQHSWYSARSQNYWSLRLGSSDATNGKTAPSQVIPVRRHQFGIVNVSTFPKNDCSGVCHNELPLYFVGDHNLLLHWIGIRADASDSKGQVHAMWPLHCWGNPASLMGCTGHIWSSCHLSSREWHLLQLHDNIQPQVHLLSYMICTHRMSSMMMMIDVLWTLLCTC